MRPTAPSGPVSPGRAGTSRRCRHRRAGRSGAPRSAARSSRTPRDRCPQPSPHRVPAESRPESAPRCFHALSYISSAASGSSRAIANVPSTLSRSGLAEDAQLFGERRGSRGVAGLQHPGQRDEQPPAACSRSGHSRPDATRCRVALGHPAAPPHGGEVREVVGERGVERGAAATRWCSTATLSSTSRAAARCSIVRRAGPSAPCRPSGPAGGAASVQVVRGVRDQETAPHGLVDRLHRLVTLPTAASGSPARTPSTAAASSRRGLGLAGGVAVADQQPERTRRRHGLLSSAHSPGGSRRAPHGRAAGCRASRHAAAGRPGRERRDPSAVASSRSSCSSRPARARRRRWPETTLRRLSGSAATASSRTASSTSTWSATSRRNAKTRARTDGWSAQCRSSTTSTTGAADSAHRAARAADCRRRTAPPRLRRHRGQGLPAAPAERASWSGPRRRAASPSSPLARRIGVPGRRRRGGLGCEERSISAVLPIPAGP